MKDEEPTLPTKGAFAPQHSDLVQGLQIQSRYDNVLQSDELVVVKLISWEESCRMIYWNKMIKLELFFEVQGTGNPKLMFAKRTWMMISIPQKPFQFEAEFVDFFRPSRAIRCRTLQSWKYIHMLLHRKL
jgi:hypothetical protein